MLKVGGGRLMAARLLHAAWLDEHVAHGPPGFQSAAAHPAKRPAGNQLGAWLMTVLTCVPHGPPCPSNPSHNFPPNPRTKCVLPKVGTTGSREATVQTPQRACRPPHLCVTASLDTGTHYLQIALSRLLGSCSLAAHPPARWCSTAPVHTTCVRPGASEQPPACVDTKLDTNM